MTIGKRVSFIRTGKKMYFHGTGNYTSVSDASTQSMAYYSHTDSTSLFDVFPSVSCWFRKSSSSAYGAILKLLGNWTGFAFGFGDGFDSSSDNSSIRFLREQVAWDTTSINVTDLNWHHIAIVFTSSSSYDVYLDGELKTSISGSFQSDYPRAGYSNGTNDAPFYGILRVGGYVPYYTYDDKTCLGNRLAKDIDITRVAIFKEKLSGDDVLADYNLGMWKKPKNASHFYSMSKIKDGMILDEIGAWNLDINQAQIVSV